MFYGRSAEGVVRFRTVGESMSTISSFTMTLQANYNNNPSKRIEQSSLQIKAAAISRSDGAATINVFELYTFKYTESGQTYDVLNCG